MFETGILLLFWGLMAHNPFLSSDDEDDGNEEDHQSNGEQAVEEEEEIEITPEEDPETASYKKQKFVWTAIDRDDWFEWTTDEKKLSFMMKTLLTEEGFGEKTWSAKRGAEETSEGVLKTFYCPCGGRTQHCRFQLRVLENRQTEETQYLLQWNNVVHRHDDLPPKQRTRLDAEIVAHCEEGWKLGVCLFSLYNSLYNSFI